MSTAAVCELLSPIIKFNIFMLNFLEENSV